MPFPTYRFLCAGICLSALILSNQAIAQEENPPRFSAELVAEWQNEYRQNSDDTNIDKTNFSFLHVELAPTVFLTQNIYLDGVFVFEPMDQVADVGSPGSIYFDRHGLFAEELKINYEDGPVHLWLGKFNPAFGQAWEWGRGIWSEDFAEDYQITEKLGGGVAYTIGDDASGEYTLAGSLFMADRSFLAHSTITTRDDLHLADGGASNTNTPTSFTLEARGENVGGIESLNIVTSIRRLAEQSEGDDATTSDETGFTLGAGYVFSVSNDLSFDLWGEYAALRDFEGVKNSDRDYVSASVVTRFLDGWNVTLGTTFRNIDDSGTESDDRLFQASGGYDFGNGFTAEAGWRNTDESDVDTDIIGFNIRYQAEF